MFQLLNAQIILMVITSPRFVKLNVQILPIMEIIKLIYVQLHVLLVLNKMIPKPVLEHVQPIIVLVINNSVIQSLYFVKTTVLEIIMPIIKLIGNVCWLVILNLCKAMDSIISVSSTVRQLLGLILFIQTEYVQQVVLTMAHIKVMDIMKLGNVYKYALILNTDKLLLRFLYVFLFVKIISLDIQSLIFVLIIVLPRTMEILQEIELAYLNVFKMDIMP